MKIALFGATGQMGHEILKRALPAGHEVTALARTPAKLDVQHPHLHVVQGDALKAEDVARVVQGQDAVISVIGARTLKRDTICEDTARNALAAMRQAGVNRLICISGAGLGDNAGFLIQNIVRPLLLKNVYADALAQDTLIQQSDLDWTIVRPYRLTNGAESNYQAAAKPFRSPLIIRMTSRSDVAAFMMREAVTPRYVRHIAYVSSRAI